MIVGGGKSAIDNAVSAAKEGVSSTLVCRSWHWPVPRLLLNAVPFQIWHLQSLWALDVAAILCRGASCTLVSWHLCTSEVDLVEGGRADVPGGSSRFQATWCLRTLVSLKMGDLPILCKFTRENE